jgi:hypothetical protein
VPDTDRHGLETEGDKLTGEHDKQLNTPTLPESASLPSAEGFAERFFSGARRRRLCREPNKKYSAKPLHSAKKALPSVK